jgi:hypothetical protein
VILPFKISFSAEVCFASRVAQIFQRLKPNIFFVSAARLKPVP